MAGSGSRTSFSPGTFVLPTFTTGKGCYLTFDFASEGSLFIHWSEAPTPPPNSVAFFQPTTSVPAFKYKQNGGRTELMRGFRGETKRRLYEGFCSFFKMSLDFKAVPVALLTSEVSVYVRHTSSEVKQMMKGQPFSLAGCTALVCVPEGNDAFTGMKTAAQAFFVDSGAKDGASVILT
jgi:hypothetical protein